MQTPDEVSLFALRLEAIGAPYMVTGATAAILYGQPRVTNDLDVVLALDDAARISLLNAFPETEFYVPPESVIRAEQARNQRGHFNLIHHESGYKADIYHPPDFAPASRGTTVRGPIRAHHCTGPNQTPSALAPSTINRSESRRRRAAVIAVVVCASCSCARTISAGRM